MTEMNTKASHVTVESPCDLYGLNARKLHHAITGTEGVLYIEKTEEQKVCRASSLLELLRLDVKKGDRIRFVATEKTRDFSAILMALDETAS